MSTYHDASGRYGAVALLPDDQVLAEGFHLAGEQDIPILEENDFSLGLLSMILAISLLDRNIVGEKKYLTSASW